MPEFYNTVAEACFGEAAGTQKYYLRGLRVTQRNARQSRANRFACDWPGESPQASGCAGAVASGECIRLFTGSPLPEGADAVIMQEHTRHTSPGSAEIQVLAPVQPGENIRFRGEDVRAGTRLLAPGEALSPSHLGLLAAVGTQKVRVGARPTVGVLATGSELVECGGSLGSGQIYESNRPMLAALIRLAGASARMLPLVPDSLDATREALAAAFKTCDLVVSCGGVSVGEMDFVKSAFASLGGKLDFWKVAIKPGRPFVFGRQGTKFLFGTRS